MENTEIPAEFDANTYRLHPTNADLQRLTGAEAAGHYQNFGRQEGRTASAVDSRLSLLRLLPAKARVLEIGPFCTPSLLRPDKDVYYLDAFSTKALRERAAKLNWADPAKVPEIDFVWDGRPYTALTDKRFPAVFSSHTIEHQPCLISHLNDVASILEARGRYFLVIPDKRYCFDHYLPQTTIADVLAAYAQSAKKHSVRTVMQDRLLHTHNDPGEHWQGRHGPDPRYFGVDEARAAILAGVVAEDHSGYIDAHAWQFTPENFRYIVTALNAAHFTRMKVERVYATLRDSFEFYAVLTL